MQIVEQHSWYTFTGASLDTKRSPKLGTVISIAPASLENMQA